MTGKSALPQQVVGLYSFPKSGNTWLRAIIAAMTGIPTGPGSLHKFVTDTHYDKVMQNPWRFEGTDWYFYKSHHKDLLGVHMGEEVKTDKVIYIYRHPLDVFLSYLNFVSTNVSPNSGRGLPFQFESVEDLTVEQMDQLFMIWLDHVTLFPKNRTFGSVFESIDSFRVLASQRPGDVLIIRYEDLMDKFDETIKAIASHLGFRNVDIETTYAVADKRTKQNGKFFWKRQKENYRNYLTDEQIGRFLARHADKMRDLGYES